MLYCTVIYDTIVYYFIIYCKEQPHVGPLANFVEKENVTLKHLPSFYVNEQFYSMVYTRIELQEFSRIVQITPVKTF